MSAAAGRLTAAVGRFNYKKWAFLYKYHQNFSGSSTPLFHFSVGLMVFGMFNDSKRRKDKLRAQAYNFRKERVMDAITKGWQAERDQQDLNISELEAAVYRVRTSNWADDLKEEDGSAWPTKFAGLPHFHDGSGSGPFPASQ